MTVQEYLDQIRKLSNKINSMKIRSDEYDRLSYSLSSPNFGDDMPHSPNRNTEAPFVKWIIKKDEIDREIEKLEKELIKLKTEALLKIETLENEDYKNILILRYFNFLTWDEIASKLYISRSTVKRWHSEGLQILEKMNRNEPL